MSRLERIVGVVLFCTLEPTVEVCADEASRTGGFVVRERVEETPEVGVPADRTADVVELARLDKFDSQINELDLEGPGD